MESVRKVKTGVYEVTFDRDVSGCPRVTETGSDLNGSINIDFRISSGQQGEASTFNVIGGDEKIGVHTSDDPWADKALQLVVLC
ncbi:MAG: hypothetical protein M3151_05700 [Actinomycetota bacterium]|nr:hypothetical protein [Actinomycetota bacterium]